MSARAADAEGADPGQPERGVGWLFESRAPAPRVFFASSRAHDSFARIEAAFSHPSERPALRGCAGLDARLCSILSGRFSLGRAVDGKLEDGRESDATATDWQLRARVFGRLHALAEFRFHEFLKPNQDLGLGLGVRYDF